MKKKKIKKFFEALKAQNAWMVKLAKDVKMITERVEDLEVATERTGVTMDIDLEGRVARLEARLSRYQELLTTRTEKAADGAHVASEKPSEESAEQEDEPAKSETDAPPRRRKSSVHITDELREQVLQLRADEESFNQIAQSTGLSFSSARRIVERAQEGKTPEPVEIPAYTVRKILAMREEGQSYDAIAAATGLSALTVCKVCKEAERV